MSGDPMDLYVAHEELRKNLRRVRRCQRALLRKAARVAPSLARTRFDLIDDYVTLNTVARAIEARLGIEAEVKP